MFKNIMVAAALTLPFVATAKAEPVQVATWPEGVPCSSLKHNSDGSWTVIDIIIGNGMRLEDVTLAHSREAQIWDQKCGQPAQK
jgi:hypothetical protein